MRIRLALLLCCLGMNLLPAGAQTVDATYRLGPEDVIVVTVLRHPEFSGEFLVPPDGMVVLPVVGKATASGRTIGELTAFVVKALSTRLRQPEVTITLKTPRMRRVFVLGSILHPGVYDIKEGWRITEALAAAGGPADNAGLANIMIIGSDGSTRTVDLTAILRDGKSEANLRLNAGDVVVVQKKVARIAVLGFVNKPGYYDIDEGRPLRLTDAISLAQGAENKRGGMSAVAVLRTKDGKQERHVYNLEKFLKKGDVTQNPEIFASDIVYVPETKRLDWGVIGQIVSAAAAVGGLL